MSIFTFSSSDEAEAVSRSRTTSVMLTGDDASFQVLHSYPAGPIETLWRACLAESDFPTHYTAPEYFREPVRQGKNPFAVLSIVGEHVTAVMTGIYHSNRVPVGAVQPPADCLFATRRSLACNE